MQYLQMMNIAGKTDGAIGEAKGFGEIAAIQRGFTQFY